MRNEALKINVSLTLVEIMNVLEYLPEGHPMVPHLTEKRDLLMAADRIQQKTIKQREGEQ